MRRNYVRRILCLPSQVAHSLAWILSDYHGIVALLVISGKQRSSELLHTLRCICVCVGHLSASVQYLRHFLHNTEALLVFQETFSHVSPSPLTSTTQPLATVPGYHTISKIVLRASTVCEWRPAATALSAVVEFCGEHTHLLRGELLLSESAFCWRSH